MKHEWRKKEKSIYLPKNKPETVDVPTYKYFTISGAGNPNSEAFGEYIAVLYALSYAVKMSPKKGIAPEGYFDYTVYPLEGVWDLSEEGKKNYQGVIDKDELVFQLMIRQPDFVDDTFAQEIIAFTKEKKAHPLLEEVQFEQITDGRCVQMLHLGPYDEEPASFARMQNYADEQGLKRLCLTHKEIYLSDARRTAPEKLKTVLRFKVS
jgi:hypothetical protein